MATNRSNMKSKDQNQSLMSKGNESGMKSQDTKNNKSSMANTIAKGAAGVAITAGIVAATAALTDKDNRKKISKTASKAMKGVSSTAQKGMEQATSIAHTITPSKAKPKNNARKTAKKK
jgi:hypothetical protein